LNDAVFWGVKRMKIGSEVRDISDRIADYLDEFVDHEIEIIVIIGIRLCKAALIRI
jgi:hypothetical protein